MAFVSSILGVATGYTSKLTDIICMIWTTDPRFLVKSGLGLVKLLLERRALLGQCAVAAVELLYLPLQLVVLLTQTSLPAGQILVLTRQFIDLSLKTTHHVLESFHLRLSVKLSITSHKQPPRAHAASYTGWAKNRTIIKVYITDAVRRSVYMYQIRSKSNTDPFFIIINCAKRLCSAYLCPVFGVCLSVCLSVSNFTSKLLNGSS